MKLFAAVALLAVSGSILMGCVTGLPKAGEVIYCPACDRDLYLRVIGTSQTAFRKAEYVPLYCDITMPTTFAEIECPFCHSDLSSIDENGNNRVSSRAWKQR